MNGMTKWASEVRVRVCGAVSDLHAADARYHKSCRVNFMFPRSTSAAVEEGHEDESSVNVDKTIDIGIRQMKDFEKNLPDGFYDSIPMKVVTMAATSGRYQGVQH